LKRGWVLDLTLSVLLLISIYENNNNVLVMTCSRSLNIRCGLLTGVNYYCLS